MPCYRVSGVDRRTQTNAVSTIDAATNDDARKEAELRGFAVIDVEEVMEPTIDPADQTRCCEESSSASRDPTNDRMPPSRGEEPTPMPGLCAPAVVGWLLAALGAFLFYASLRTASPPGINLDKLSSVENALIILAELVGMNITNLAGLACCVVAWRSRGRSARALTVTMILLIVATSAAAFRDSPSYGGTQAVKPL